MAKKKRIDFTPEGQFKTLLSEMKFPATRTEIVDFARRKRYDDSLIDLLEDIPDLTYQPNQLARLVNGRW